MSRRTTHARHVLGALAASLSLWQLASRQISIKTVVQCIVGGQMEQWPWGLAWSDEAWCGLVSGDDGPCLAAAAAAAGAAICRSLMLTSCPGSHSHSHYELELEQSAIVPSTHYPTPTTVGGTTQCAARATGATAAATAASHPHSIDHDQSVADSQSVTSSQSQVTACVLSVV